MEILKALKTIQSGKTPGPDGIPVEFYKQYAKELAVRLHTMLLEAQTKEELPPSLSDAVVVVIPKPGKDPSLCSSYHPISLINVDAKLLAEVLANRLSTVILALVHLDQTGFMSGRGTDINIKRLFTHMARADSESAGVVTSLDAEKAFDSVEWGYLWGVLSRFGFGSGFMTWLRMLYADPRARVHMNGCLSDSFPPGRGVVSSNPSTGMI